MYEIGTAVTPELVRNCHSCLQLDAELQLSGNHGLVRLRLQAAAMMVVGRNVDELRHGIVCGWRPILAAPQRRTEIDQHAPARSMFGDVLRPARFRVDAL